MEQKRNTLAQTNFWHTIRMWDAWRERVIRFWIRNNVWAKSNSRSSQNIPVASTSNDRMQGGMPGDLSTSSWKRVQSDAVDNVTDLDRDFKTYICHGWQTNAYTGKVGRSLGRIFRMAYSSSVGSTVCSGKWSFFSGFPPRSLGCHQPVEQKQGICLRNMLQEVRRCWLWSGG
jgi:hypothetical protein